MNISDIDFSNNDLLLISSAINRHPNLTFVAGPWPVHRKNTPPIEGLGVYFVLVEFTDSQELKPLLCPLVTRDKQTSLKLGDACLPVWGEVFFDFGLLTTHPETGVEIELSSLEGPSPVTSLHGG